MPSDAHKKWDEDSARGMVWTEREVLDLNICLFPFRHASHSTGVCSPFFLYFFIVYRKKSNLLIKKLN
jgi:hypothetical protein